MMSKKIILLICIFSVFTACATIEPMRPSVVKGPENIVDKNYEIEKLQQVYVGEEVIRVKDYWVNRIIQNKMRSLNDFILETPYTTHFGSVSDTYDIGGVITHQKRKLYLIKIPEMGWMFGVTESGEWADIVVNNAHQIFTPAGGITPDDTKFESVKETKIDASQGFVNYEIVFTGTTGDSMTLLYREYTPKDMARPAFYQNLTYPLDTDVVRFKQVRIKIHEVTSEKISYTVLEDGLN